MKRLVLWMFLVFLVTLLALACARTAQVQASSPPPAGEYLLTWQLGPGCNEQGAVFQAPQSLSCASTPPFEPVSFPASQSAPWAQPADPELSCRRADPPADLWRLVLDLQAAGQVRVLERVPDQPALRLLADAEAAEQLSLHPRTEQLRLLHPLSALPGVEGRAPVAEDEILSSEPSTPAVPGGIAPAALPEEVIIYTWVNNQGDDPPITYDWIEISITGMVVAQGDDTYTQVALGFPFRFYGTDYTQAYVSSNGFLTFGTGSTDWSNDPIPDPFSPNNAIYAFWDDLDPTGGGNGNVYAQQMDADTYVVEWHQVKHGYFAAYETFEIILDGAENTIRLQYQAVEYAHSCSVGVENSTGILGTQYAYNDYDALVDGLAVERHPYTGYVVSGQVTDHDGAGISGITVATSPGDPMIASTTTGAAGDYQLILESGSYTLRASKSGYVSPPSQSIVVPPDQATVDFVFDLYYTVSGTVRDYDGAPLADIDVRSSPLGLEATTDATGQYVLHLPAGLHCLSLCSYDLPEPPPQSVQVPPTQAGVDFTFPQRYMISGVVQDSAGTPQPDVRVHTDWEDPLYASDWTDSNGEYTLVVIAGAYTVVADQDGRVDTASTTVTVPPDRPGTDLVFPPAYSVSGTVTDADGQPLEDVDISISQVDGSAYAYVYTGTDGRYQLWALAGTWHLSAYKSGLDSPPSQTITLPSDRVVDFTFPVRGYTISGTVRDTAGDPFPNIYVIAWSECWDEKYGSVDSNGHYTITVPQAGTYLVEAGPERQVVSVPPSASGVDFTLPPASELYQIAGTVFTPDGQPVSGARVQTMVGSEAEYDYTDSDGHYELQVPAGSYQLTASQANYLPSPPQTVTVPPNQPDVDLTLQAGHLIEGTVVDDEDHPLYDVTVQAEGSAGSYTSRTSACGTYRLLVPAGSYAVSASETGYATPTPQDVTVPPDRFDVDFTLAALPHYAIAGTVHDSGGAPLQDVSVYADGGDTWHSTRTDAGGAYAFQVWPGTYEVRVYRSGYSSPPAQIVSVPPDRSGVDFTFAALYTIRGTVRDANGAGLPEAWVRPYDSVCGNQKSSTAANASGAYTLTLPAGSYDLTAVHHGYSALALQRVTLPPAANGIDFTIPLPVLYAVSGTVREPGGAPIADVWMYASRCGGPPGSAYTSVDGTYTLLLAAGSYTLEADAWGTGWVGQQIDITVAGNTPGVDFTLSPAYHVFGCIADESGDPVYDADVWADGPDYNSEYSCYNGRYHLILDEPGTYKVDASKSGYVGAAPRTVTLPPNRGDMDLVLPTWTGEMYVISGMVRDENGQPMAGVSVDLYGEDLDEWDDTGADGRYTFTVLPGDYAVYTYHSCYTDSPDESVTVPPDATVDLSFLHRKANRVTGRLTDSNGAAVVRGYVDADGAAGSAYASSDSNGNYVLRLSPGNWTLSASQPYYCSYLSPPDQVATVPPDKSGVNFLFTIGAYTCEGQVTDLAGVPMDDVRVDAESTCGSTYTYTNAQGHYLLRLSACPWTLQPYRYHYRSIPAEWVVTVPPNCSGKDFRIYLPVDVYLPLILRNWR